MSEIYVKGGEKISVQEYGNNVYQKEEYSRIPDFLLYLQWLDLRYSRIDNPVYNRNGSVVLTDSPQELYRNTSHQEFIELISKTDIHRQELYDIEKLAYLDELPSDVVEKLEYYSKSLYESYLYSPSGLEEILDSISSRVDNLVHNNSYESLDRVNNVLYSYLYMVKYMSKLESFITLSETIKQRLFFNSNIVTLFENNQLKVQDLNLLDLPHLDLNLSQEQISQLVLLINNKISELNEIETKTELDEKELTMLTKMKEELADTEKTNQSDVAVASISFMVLQLADNTSEFIVSIIEYNKSLGKLSTYDKISLKSTSDDISNTFGMDTSTFGTVNTSSTRNIADTEYKVKDKSISDTKDMLKGIRTGVQNARVKDESYKKDTILQINKTNKLLETVTILDNGYNIEAKLDENNAKIKSNNDIISKNNNSIEESKQWLDNNSDAIDSGTVNMSESQYHTDNIGTRSNENTGLIDENTVLQQKQGVLLKSISSVTESADRSSPTFFSGITDMSNKLSQQNNNTSNVMENSKILLLASLGISSPILVMANNKISGMSNISDSSSSYTSAIKTSIGSMFNLMSAPLEVLMLSANIAICTIKEVLCLAAGIINTLVNVGKSISKVLDEMNSLDNLTNSVGSMYDEMSSSLSSSITSANSSAMCRQVRKLTVDVKDDVTNKLSADKQRAFAVASANACSLAMDMVGPDLASLIEDEANRVMNNLASSVTNMVDNLKSIKDVNKCELNLPGLDIGLDFKLGSKGIGPFALKIPYIDSKVVKCH